TIGAYAVLDTGLKAPIVAFGVTGLLIGGVGRAAGYLSFPWKTIAGENKVGTAPTYHRVLLVPFGEIPASFPPPHPPESIGVPYGDEPIDIYPARKIGSQLVG